MLLLLVLCLYPVAGAIASSEKSMPGEFTSADLKADVDILEGAYEALHPGLLRYNTSAQMQAQFATLERELDHDQSRASVFVALSRFAATIRCGHTYANFYNQSDAVQGELFKNANRVPFYFRWLDGHMIVTRNFSSEKRLVPGAEILSISGVSTQEILKTLMSVARADGSNDAKRIAYLEVQGHDAYEAFDIFLPLFYPQIGAHQKLQVQDAKGYVWKTTVQAISYEERVSERSGATVGKDPWSLTFPRANVALLTMPTWAMYKTKWDWRGFLARTFEELQRRDIRSLVIDLRANEGGDDVGDEILGHLVDRALRLPGYQRLVRYRSIPSELSPYLQTWDASFKDWGTEAEPYDDRYYRLVDGSNGEASKIIPAQAPRFVGHVYVLVGPTNSSATFQFALVAKEQQLATLVGQPTGGNRRGINGGAFFFLQLPHSGLEIDLPLIGFFPTDAQPDAGVEPDLRVATSRSDIAATRDVEMEEALKLASNTVQRKVSK